MRSLEGAVLTFVANALWQAPLLAGLAWAGAGLLRRAPAAYRHRLWLAALVLAVLSPLASAVRPSPPAAAHASGRDGEAGLGALLGAERGAAEAAKRLSLRTGRSMGRRAGPVAMVYLLFLATRAARLVAAWRRTARLVRGAKAAPASMGALVAECAAAFGRHPDVRVSAEVGTPMTFGLRRPVIVLPKHFATRAAPEDLRGALAHELSHVVRRDCAVNLASELLALPVAFHPAVRFLKRRLIGAREAACDETATAFVGAASYARTLLEVARSALPRTRFAGAMGALDGDCLEDRMKRILDGSRSMRRSTATVVLGTLVLALATAGRVSSATALRVTSEAGPSDMVGRWTATWQEGPAKGQPAAEMTIALTPEGPDIALMLYRYRADDGRQPESERVPVIQHGVEDGVLHFRTRVEEFRVRPDEPLAPMEADWTFEVVGPDAGKLNLLRNSKLEADKAQGKAVPPKPPPLPMKRVSK